MISLKDINFSYNGDQVLRELSFVVEEGEFLGIIGPNGAGKSTLLKLLNRVLLPQSGEICLQGKPLDDYSRRRLAQIIGFVPQQFSAAFRFSVQEIVLMGRFPHQSAFGWESETDIRIAEEAMTATDCYHLRERDFFSLSGGEQQRVVLASALAQQPQILLLDEPTTALDLKHQLHFFRILQDLQREKKMTILTVTHDVNLAARFCRRILALKDGRMVADGAVKTVLTKEIVQTIYETPVEIVAHPRDGLPVILPV